MPCFLDKFKWRRTARAAQPPTDGWNSIHFWWFFEGFLKCQQCHFYHFLSFSIHFWVTGGCFFFFITKKKGCHKRCKSPIDSSPRIPQDHLDLIFKPQLSHGTSRGFDLPIGIYMYIYIYILQGMILGFDLTPILGPYHGSFNHKTGGTSQDFPSKTKSGSRYRYCQSLGTHLGTGENPYIN